MDLYKLVPKSKFLSASVVEYLTNGNIKIKRKSVELDMEKSTDRILNLIDSKKGALFSSSYEYPGRYSRWDIGFINPCLELKAKEL